MPVDSQTTTLSGGETTTATLQFATSASNPDDTGGYEATVASDTDTDTTLFVVGTRDLTRFADAVSPGGDAISVRTIATLRGITANVERGAASVTRTATIGRSPTVSGRGAAVSSWVAPDAWALPESPDALADVLLTPSAVETTYDELSLSATIAETKREALSHYRRAGNVTRRSTAFGAFRRIRRDGNDLLTVRPPESESPPWTDQHVAPLDMSVEQTAPNRHELGLTLGLSEPRAREPIQPAPESLRVDEESVTIAGGATETTTLSWTPDGTQLGDWTVTVSAPGNSDSAVVAVSDAPWVFSWPVATLPLTERRVGQVTRDSDASIPTIELPLRLERGQAATLLAVGSRIEAVETRAVPDAPNTVVDTLPGNELTCGLQTPTESGIPDGSYILRDWSVSHARPAPPAFDATVTLVRND